MHCSGPVRSLRRLFTTGSGNHGLARALAIVPGEPAKPVEEKSVSYVRKEFRATADARRRPGLIAEAMVDADIEIPEVIAKGKLLTLTTEEALRHKVADRQVSAFLRAT